MSKSQFLKADGKAVSAGTADYASQTLFDKATTISATNLNVNTWYPVVSTNTIPYTGLRHIKCNVQLNSGTKPSWSTHSAGFTVNLDMLVTAYGWGRLVHAVLFLIILMDLSHPAVLLRLDIHK